MEPPPQLLVLIIVWVGGAVSETPEECNDFPKKNIHLDATQDVEPSVTYINHLEDKRYFLYCHVKTNTAVIASPKGEHVVTIEEFPCEDRRTLTEKSYMFLYSSPDPAMEKISFGIFTDKSKEWCRYDICIKCPSSQEKTIQLNSISLPNSLPDKDFFQWSEKYVQIPILNPPQSHLLHSVVVRGKTSSGLDGKNSEYSLLVGIPITMDTPKPGYKTADIVAEYVSIGDPKFVLVCFAKGHVVVRSTMGHHIVTLDRGVECSPNTPPNIQTFYVLTTYKDKTEFPAVLHDYRLAKITAEGGSKYLSWYNGREREETNKRMFFYFLAKSSSKTCYWKQINIEKPNSCPSLPDDAVIQDPLIYRDIREKSRLATAARYRNLVTPILTFTCFTNNENKEVNYLFVVTDSKGEHVVTIKDVDCSSKGNLDRKFFVHTTYGDENMNFIVVGSRWSVSDDWCTYSIDNSVDKSKQEPKQPMWFFSNRKSKQQSKITKWVYYDYNPEDAVLSWEEVDIHQCPSLDRRNIVLEDFETNGKVLSARYLGPSDSIADSLFLFCYSSNPNGDAPSQTINVIKTVKGATIALITGFDCLYKAEDQKLYIIKDKIGENYLVIGTRSSSEEEWCQYDVCVDCKKKEAKRNFNTISWNEAIKWTEAGVKQEGGSQSLVPDYNTENIMKQYETWRSNLVVVCVKSEQQGKYNWVLRKPRGTQIGTIHLGLDCAQETRLRLKLYIHTTSASGESNLYSYDDCSDDCGVPSDSDTETWFYYFTDTGGYFFVKDWNADDPNSCKTLKRVNILTKELDSPKGEVTSTYWNGGNPRFTLNCYPAISATSLPYAVINTAGKHVMTLLDFDCQETTVQKIYVHSTSGDGDVSQVVVGSLDTGYNPWCYYNVVTDVEKNNVWVYPRYEPDKLAEQWYKEDSSCPVLPENIITNHESNGNDQDVGPVRKTFVSSGYKQIKTLYCHKKTDSSGKLYTLVIKSATGKHELTVKGIYCSKLTNLYVSYMEIKEKISLVFWAEKESKDWCRYDICLSCNKREVQINIDKDPNNSKLRAEKLKWTEVEKSIKEQSTGWLEGDTVSITNTIDEIQKHYTLYAKFVNNDDANFQLHCYIKVETKRYRFGRYSEITHLAVVTDANGQPIVMIEYSDQTLDDCDSMLNVKLDGTDGDANIVTLGRHYIEPLELYYEMTRYYAICWNCETPFITRTGRRLCDKKKWHTWKKMRPDDCALIKRKDIYIDKSEVPSGSKLVAKYSNNEPEKKGTWFLHCYETDNRKYVSVLRNLEGSYLMSIEGLDCSSSTLLQHASYIHIKKTEKGDVVYVGTRVVLTSPARDSPWCQYSVVATTGERADLSTDSISDNEHFSWTEDDSEDCLAVNSENTFTDKNEESLANKNLNTKYIMEDFEDDGKGTRGNQKELFYIYCYDMEDDGGKGKYMLVIRSVEGRHLATIKDFDCSLQAGLEKNTYMYTMTQLGYPDYLAFVSRASTENVKWCQYFISLNGKTKEVRKNKILSDRNKYFRWEKDFSENCRAVKSEKILTDEYEKKLDDKNLQSVFEMAVFNHKQKDEKEAFLIYCYHVEDDAGNGIYMMVIRTAEGRHLATVRQYCSPKEAPYSLQDNTYVFTLTFSGHDYLALGTRASAADEWCRYDICISCKERVVGRNIHWEDDQTFYWKPVSHFKRPQSSKDSPLTEVVVVQQNWNNAVTLVAKYKSGGFQLHCYQDSSSNNYSYIAFIMDRHGKQFAKIEDLYCLSIKELHKNIRIIFYKNVDNEDDVALINNRRPDDATCCKYGKCDICTRTMPQLLGLHSEWIKVPLESCYSLPQENIFTAPSEVDLNDYKVLTTYVNDYRKDEDTFVLVCYQNDDSNESKRFITHVKTLGNKHVVSIRNLDCSSRRMLSRISYMSIMTAEGNRYLALGTRSARGDEIGDWCRYDICISCTSKDIRVNSKDDPESIETFKWSTVTNPSRSSMESSGFLGTKEEKECLPKSKTISDLEPGIPAVIPEKKTVD